MIVSVAATEQTPAARKPLRRLGVKLVALVVAKILVLTLIWWIAIAPHPRPDASPRAIEQLLAPAHASSHGGSP